MSEAEFPRLASKPHGFDPFHYGHSIVMERKLDLLTAFTTREDSQIMSALDDLNSAIADLSADIGSAIADLEAAQNNNDDAGVEAAAAVAKLRDLHTQLAAAVAAVPAATPPAQPAPPTTGAAVVSSISPTSGPVGTTVSITGTGFNGAESVTIGGVSVPSSDIAVQSDTQSTAIVPAGIPAGASPVIVVTAAGPSNSNVTFSLGS